MSKPSAPGRPPAYIAGARVLTEAARRPPLAYTIGTLVNDAGLYAGMRESFLAGGFGATDCEHVAIDNTGPEQVSAYAGLNMVLDAARGRHVILCHQDVRLQRDGRAELDARLAELEARDPGWALAGNAGGVSPGRLAIRISDPHGRDRRVGALPARVASLDENFIVVKRAARIGFSRDLDGYHLYGADICMAADAMGYSAWVIDFHLEHLSAGNRLSASFAQARRAFETKWSRALRPRFVQTTCALVGLSGGRLGSFVGRAAAKPLSGIARRLPSARGWNDTRA